MKEIVVRSRQAQLGIEGLINKRKLLAERIEQTVAYNKSTCEEKLKLIRNLEVVEEILRNQFDLQTFEYCGCDIKIVIQ